MKRVVLVAVSLLAIGGLSYVLPRIYGIHAARPLHGVFDTKLECIGGHEVFVELTQDAAFSTCPGHRDRRKEAAVVRAESAVTVIDSRDGKPWFRIDWDGSRHSLTFLKRPDSQSTFGMISVRGEIRQVTDPWRLWLPRLLPEN